MIVAVSPLIAKQYGKRIRAVSPAIELVWPNEGGGWSGEADAVEVVYFSEDFWTTGSFRSLLPQLFTLSSLRWFHTFSAGVDNPAFRMLVERGVVLTNSSGITREPIAQYVIAMMLRVVKRMDDWSQAQRERRWEPIETGELTGKTVGIVGGGQIGGEVARLGKAVGIPVVGCPRRRRRTRSGYALLAPERRTERLATEERGARRRLALSQTGHQSAAPGPTDSLARLVIMDRQGRL